MGAFGENAIDPKNSAGKEKDLLYRFFPEVCTVQEAIFGENGILQTKPLL